MLYYLRGRWREKDDIVCGGTEAVRVAACPHCQFALLLFSHILSWMEGERGKIVVTHCKPPKTVPIR